MTSQAIPAAWQPIAGLQNAWQSAALREGVPLRAVALRLAGGALAVYSPIRGLGDASHAALAGLGAPALLVAPNHFHHLGLAEYAAAHPGAAVVASPAAVPRVARRCGHAVADLDRLRAALPGHASLLLPPDTRNGELWLSVAGAGGRAWIVGDAFFNILRTPTTPMGLLLKLLGISPGLRIGSSFRWLLRDRAAYRRWLLDRIAEERPTTLIPCHGELVTDQALPERLARLAEARL